MKRQSVPYDQEYRITRKLRTKHETKKNNIGNGIYPNFETH